MDYVIKNDRNLYIRLNKQGLPVSCGQSNKGLFTNDKDHTKSKYLSQLKLESKSKDIFIQELEGIINEE